MQDIEKLKACYGELCLQLEIVQNKHLEAKKLLIQALQSQQQKEEPSNTMEEPKDGPVK